mmetsp:Transcript_39550/g.108958  ORF Transcript_39550/g.108958 Transcript_39550/m.108958 type:complete len:209 (-) Transcript_39550:1382-2008(-)
MLSRSTLLGRSATLDEHGLAEALGVADLPLIKAKSSAFVASPSSLTSEKAAPFLITCEGGAPSKAETPYARALSLVHFAHALRRAWSLAGSSARSVGDMDVPPDAVSLGCMPSSPPGLDSLFATGATNANVASDPLGHDCEFVLECDREGGHDGDCDRGRSELPPSAHPDDVLRPRRVLPDNRMCFGLRRSSDPSSKASTNATAGWLI